MTVNTALRTPSSVSSPALTQIWSGRCPVPTASGIALKLGWLADEFAPDGISVSDRRDRQQQALETSSLPHAIYGLLREGGNIPVLTARSRGEDTRLIGLTWIDEGQALIVRPNSGITEPKHLKGKRIALPAFGRNTNDTRGSSIWRGMTLQGVHGALSYAGLNSDDDVTFVEQTTPDWEDGLQAVLDGKADTSYVKGAAAADAVRNHGLAVGIDLDKLPDRRFRINNGTPRPLTVRSDFLEEHFDIVVRYLYQSLRAAEWAKTNLHRVHEIYQGETRGSADGVATAYRDGFHLSLHPSLSDERLGYFRKQKDFLLSRGFLDRDFDLDAWVDFRPIVEAQKLLANHLKAVA